MIPDPLNLRARDLSRHASDHERKLRREENELRLKRKVDGVLPVHAADIRQVAYDPVKMTDPAKEEGIAGGGLEVDDRQLARATHREDVDLAARMARNTGVDRSQALLERVGTFHQERGQPLLRQRGGSQKGDASPGPGRRRRALDRTRGGLIAGRRLAGLLRQEEVGDIFQSSTKWLVRTAGAVRAGRTVGLVLVHIAQFACAGDPASSTTRIESCPPYGLGSTTAFNGSFCHCPSTT